MSKRGKVPSDQQGNTEHNKRAAPMMNGCLPAVGHSKSRKHNECYNITAIITKSSVFCQFRSKYVCKNKCLVQHDVEMRGLLYMTEFVFTSR
ncbi:hypothetical protein VYA_02830 [Vibrio alfacsensis]|nr:hypothetical protein VYA_02830 [Vibrio alfacsensis]